MKWYNKTFWVIVFCIIYPPLGIIFTWLHPKWPERTKILITFATSLYLIQFFQKFKPFEYRHTIYCQ